MFGYVKPHVPLLRVADYEYYKAAYCSLCRYMGRECGALSRLTLSYDITFLSLLRLYLTGERATIERHPCAFSPVLKNMLSKTEAVSYCAACGGVLAALKNEDDIADERGGKRLLAKLIRPVTKSWTRRVEKNWGTLVKRTQNGLDAFYAVENESRDLSIIDGKLDGAADAFGALLGELVASGLEDENYEIAKQIGKHIGRWVYFVDAIDDMQEDIKKGRYNPIISAYGGRMPNEDERLTLSCLLGAECNSALSFLSLSESDTDSPEYRIIENTICESMPRVAEAVLNGTYQRSGREDISRGLPTITMETKEGK